MYKRMVGLILIGLFIQAPVFAADDEWQFMLTPYIWFAGMEGDVSTVPGAPVVPVELSASDALSDTQASFMLLFEAKKNKQGMLFDFLYTDVETDTTLIDQINLSMKSTSINYMFSAAYEYEVYNQNRAVADIYGGLRYWKVDTKLEFSGGLGLLAGKSISNDDSWVDPLIGIKGLTYFGSSKVYIVGWLAGGGFGVGSESFYDISANIGYQWNKAIGTTVGYRYLAVDYENDSFVYDVTQQGWGMALTWTF